MGMGVQQHALAALPPGKGSSTHSTGGCVSPRIGPDGYGKSSSHWDLTASIFRMKKVCSETSWGQLAVSSTKTVEKFKSEYKELHPRNKVLV